MKISVVKEFRVGQESKVLTGKKMSDEGFGGLSQHVGPFVPKSLAVG